MERAALPRRLKWWTGSVVETIRETPTASSLIIDVPGWLGHRAGQHVDVRLTAEDGYQAMRSYSIASAPDARWVTLTIECLKDGEVSPYLVGQVLPGDPLEFLGPIGGFFVWTEDMGGPLQLIAGGSGIVPLMSMLRYRRQAGSAIPARLLYSARTAANLIYRSELDQLSETDDRLRIDYTLTRRQLDGWTGYRRRVDLTMLGEVAWNEVEHPLIYVCGPTPFVEIVSSLLLELGHDAGRIRTERFGPTGG